MSPQEILEAVAEVYARCVTYRDSGQVITRFHSPGNEPPRIGVKPFTTAFHRPDRFASSTWTDARSGANGSDTSSGSEGRRFRTWWDIRPGVLEPESLELALAGATGVSGRSAHTPEAA